MNPLTRRKSSHENERCDMETGLSRVCRPQDHTGMLEVCFLLGWEPKRTGEARHQFPTASPEWTSNEVISHAHIRGMWRNEVLDRASRLS